MAEPSPNVIACISNVESLKLELKTKELEVKSTEEKLHAAENDLAAALEGGSTTGDWLRDESIKAWGLDPAMEAAYRAVHDSLAGHKGEFVLLVYDCSVRVRTDSFLDKVLGTPSYGYRKKTLYRLGALEDDKLILIFPKRWGRHESPLLGLPVTKFIEGEKKPFPSANDLCVVERGLFDPYTQDRDPPHFTQYIGDKANPSLASSMSLIPSCGPTNVELMVGNEVAKAWLQVNVMGNLYRPAAHALGMLEFEPTGAV